MRQFFLTILLFLAITTNAQMHEIFDENIASLSVMRGSDWMSLPVTTLNGEPINIEFDELSHVYHRYIYKVEHCEADWTVSESLFSSDYISGMYDDNTIDNYEESVGTYQLYTHYSLSFPNDKCSLTMSGNYRLSIYDDNDDDRLVLRAYFMICENTAGVTLAMTTNTDKDINGRHQQINMAVSYGRLNVTDPDNQIRTIVMQNQRLFNAVNNPKAQYKMRDGLKWEHCKELIFMAGNEHHKFETLDPTHTTMGLASVGWDEDNSQWHAYVHPDIPQPHYSYDVDANGAFLIRNSDNIDNNTVSDYIVTHFELHAPYQFSDVYINGNWTGDFFNDKTRMEWNEELQVYEKSLLLKQGYYSYRYLTMDKSGSMHSISSEGDFYETENSYQALVYFRGPGDRTDRLVAFVEL